MKKLKDAESSLSIFLDRIALLGSHLGPVLFQLPPRWHFDSDRLERFLAALGKEHCYAFELRDHSSINDRALDLLARYKAAFCIYELDGFLSPREVTADFVYLRLHGPNGPYQGDYDRQVLIGWAEACVGWLASGLDVYCYFDNDESGHAVANALTLRGLLDSQT